MDRLEHYLSESEISPTLDPSLSHLKGGGRRLGPNCTNKIAIDVNLPASISFDFLDEDLQNFLDRVIATGIIII